MIQNKTFETIPEEWTKTLQNVEVVVEYGEDIPEDADAYTEVIDGVHHVAIRGFCDEATINHELIHVYDKNTQLSDFWDFHKVFDCPIAELPNYEVLAYALEELHPVEIIEVLEKYFEAMLNDLSEQQGEYLEMIDAL